MLANIGLTITREAIAVEGVASGTATSVAAHSVGACLTAPVSPQRALINIYMASECMNATRISQCFQCTITSHSISIEDIA